MRTYREERDAWREAYERLKGRSEETLTSLEGRVNEIETRLADERAGWKREIRRARGPGFGVFVGYGWTPSGEGQLVGGIGLVWRF